MRWRNGEAAAGNGQMSLDNSSDQISLYRAREIDNSLNLRSPGYCEIPYVQSVMAVCSDASQIHPCRL